MDIAVSNNPELYDLKTILREPDAGFDRDAADTDAVAAFLLQMLAIEQRCTATALATRLGLIRLRAGTALPPEADGNEAILLVLHGRIEAGMGTPVRDLRRGGFVRTAAITAIRDSLVLRFDRATIDWLMQEHPVTAMRLFRALAMPPHAEQARVSCRITAVIPIGSDPVMSEVVGFLVRDHAARGERAAMLTSPDADMPMDRQIGLAEAAADALFLVTDPTATLWSHACIAHADQIVLIADAAQGEPARQTLEQDLLGPDDVLDPRPITLVLLHPAPTISPTGTRRWLEARTVARHIHVRRGDERHLRRLARWLAGRSVGLVLSGGGARGLAHVGVLEALDAHGIEIDQIGGTSIGAVIGGLAAMGLAGDALRAAVHRAFIAEGNPVGDFQALPLVSLARGARARKVTQAGIAAAAGAAIDLEDCWIGFSCVATNLSAARSVTLARGAMANSILASFAIPGVMPPVVIDQQLHIDGGVSDNLPVEAMAGIGVARIIAVDVVATPSRRYPFTVLPGRWSLLRDRLMRRRRVPGLLTILYKASVVGAVARQAAQAAGADVVIRPRMQGVGQMGWTRMDVAVEAGRVAAAAELAALAPERRAGLVAQR